VRNDAVILNNLIQTVCGSARPFNPAKLVTNNATKKLRTLCLGG
jgi:hypothetical protein